MKLKQHEVPETRKPTFSLATTSSSIENDLLKRFSSMRTLIQVIVYCRRFAYNAQAKNKDKFSGKISNDEGKSASNCIIKLIQSSAFAKEIESLSKNQDIHKKSKLLALSPFLDKGILKVGGRLTYPDLSYEKKYPILLPRNHHITEMIIRSQHLDLKHAGVQSTLYAIREQYWPIDGRNTTRKIIRQCMT